MTNSPDSGPRPMIDDPMAWLVSLQRFGMNPGLSRVHALLAAIGTPQRAFEVVLVAGTNGKGSTAKVLSACLRGAGRRTGLFISPHLQRFGERATVDGAETSAAEMADAIRLVRPHAERLGATFFEVVTAVCALVFKRAGVKVAVMEVGLGGRLDATNALEPVLSIITSVALDHMAVLGQDVASIAIEKAGVMRQAVPALTAATGSALRAIEDEALRIGAPLTVLGRDLHVRVLGSSWDGLELAMTGLVDDIDAELRVSTPLVGRHQAHNVALACAGAVVMHVPRAAVRAAVEGAVWPGRLERIAYRGRHVVLDGAHNSQSAEALAMAMTELAPTCDVLVLGTSADKDHDGLLGPLVQVAPTVVVTRSALSPRATEPTRLAELVVEAQVGAGLEPRKLEVITIGDPAEALAVALDLAPPGGTIVVAGSLFLVGEMRTLLLDEQGEQAERWQ
ncbi:MAG TPA: folylpolyglutamate synthase/dihydrofolate synthase family protein [Trueperaceae bacterium]|nr:folylpolyglutamate synthase/dihydrofolate synthase family protein [Trueperaceae bacterium]